MINKLRIIFLPFSISNDDWKRQMHGSDMDSEASTPRGDLQAPDLYIPLMAFVTYILLVGISAGFLNDT